MKVEKLMLFKGSKVKFLKKMSWMSIFSLNCDLFLLNLDMC